MRVSEIERRAHACARRLAGRSAGAVALAATVALGAGCAGGKADPAGDAFQSATVERKDIVSSVVATGTLEPIKVIEVKSQASGEILEMPVQLGEHVSQGDLLVRIDPRDVRNAYQQAQADLQVAKARQEVTTRRLQRARTLRDSAVVTDEELENAILDQADAQAAVVKAETNLELARDRLNDATVRAPISGTIVEKSVEEGQIITSTRDVTGGTVLLRMADLQKVQVRTLVDETDIGKLQAGLPASITVEAYPDRKFEGQVLKIEPQAVVEQNVTMFAVLTQISNENDLLRPGMNADVEIEVGRRQGVLALPNGAVKTVDEARQLARAMGLDPSLLQARAAEPAGKADAPVGSGGALLSRDTAGAVRTGDGPDLEKLQAMSQEERRSYFQSLSPADRRRMLEAMRAQREAEQRDRSDPTRPRPAFVFEEGPEGRLTLKPITIGLSSWELTEVVGGLQEGDRVLEVPLSLVQQQELLQRIRRRTSLPGMNRN